MEILDLNNNFTIADSFRFFYGNAILYLAIAAIFILYRIIYNENSNRTSNSVLIINLCKILVIQAVCTLLFTIFNIMIYDYDLIEYPFMSFLMAFFGLLTIYFSAIFPYYFFITIRKYVKDKFIFSGFLNKITFSLFCIFTLVYSCFSSLTLNLFYNQEDIANEMLIYVVLIAAIIQTICILLVIKEIHGFSLRLLKESFFTKTACAICMIVFVYIPFLSWPISLIYGLPLSFIVSVSFIFVIHIISQSNSVSRDFLTGMNNRNELMRYLKKKFESKDELTSRLCLIFIDINQFKSINDTYGHSQGDKALINMSRCLFKSAFDSDCFLCRYAGDEFVVVIKENTVNTVERFKQKLETNLSSFNSENSDPYNLSVAIGAVCYSDEYNTIEKFISASDASMYKIKNGSKS